MHIVKHSDFIPAEYLPTFSANPIELNMHRIEGLAENFVYFNDDFFLNAPVEPEFFFKNGLPCDYFLLNYMFFKKYWDRFGLMIANNYAVINSHFSRKDLFKHLAKIFSPAHSFGDWKKNLQYLLRKHSYISVLDNPHLPHSFKKSYFEKLWDMEPEICAETSQSKFRKPTDITSWLVRDLQLMEGSFTPVSRKSRGKYFSLESATAEKIATRMKKNL